MWLFYSPLNSQGFFFCLFLFAVFAASYVELFLAIFSSFYFDNWMRRGRKVSWCVHSGFQLLFFGYFFFQFFISMTFSSLVKMVAATIWKRQYTATVVYTSFGDERRLFWWISPRILALGRKASTSCERGHLERWRSVFKPEIEW